VENQQERVIHVRVSGWVKCLKMLVCGTGSSCYGWGVSKEMIQAEWPMRDILERLPGARRALFAKYHLGGCQSCAFSESESLVDLCRRSQLDEGEVLAHLLASHEHDLAMWIEPMEAAARRGEFRWIDLRTREEFEAVVLTGAELFTQELQQALFSQKPEQPILLFDHTGRSVLDQVAWFRGHGLNQTYALKGGIDAWSREVDPHVRRYRLEIDN
jgi:rhodanese-related sulfurtransferase